MRSWRKEDDTSPSPPPKRVKPTSSEQLTCPVCLENEKNYALAACGHVFCGACVDKVETCPVCRKACSGEAREIFI